MKVYLDGQLVDLSVQGATNAEGVSTDGAANIPSTIPVDAEETSNIPSTDQDTAF